MIDLSFLKQGAQRPEEVAEEVCAFIASAKKTLDIAMYDFQPSSSVEELIKKAMTSALGRGVHIRTLLGKPNIPFELENSLRVVCDGESLMHHKYMVADAALDSARVWTGTADFTDDAFSRQENTLVTLESPEAAFYYTRDFDELWHSDKIFGTGVGDRAEFSLVPPLLNGEEDESMPEIDLSLSFCPSDESVCREIAEHILNAQDRVKVASTCLGSAPILAALLATEVEEFSGIYDATAQHSFMTEWKRVGGKAGERKLKMFEAIASRFACKRSAPAGSKHIDRMANRLAVVDDTVIVGSMYWTNSENNAENTLFIHDADLADSAAEYIDDVVDTYRAN